MLDLLNLITITQDAFYLVIVFDYYNSSALLIAIDNINKVCEIGL